MPEPHGYRDALHWRIRAGNIAATVFGGLTVILALLTATGELAEEGIFAGGATLALALGAVRLVTWCRVELFKLGPPGPRVVRDDG